MSSDSDILAKFQVPRKYRGYESSIWGEFDELIEKYQPLDLAVGFTDYPPPKYFTDTLAAVPTGTNHMLNQYTRMSGHPRLVKALAALYSKLIKRDIDAYDDVVVVTSAHATLFATIQGHVDEGDEVIVIEPFFDCYVQMIEQAGGIPRIVQLRPQFSAEDGVMSSADWVWDDKELAAVFNEKTKAIIVNTPNNPLGKVFSRDELTQVTDLCKKHNVLCISDEVYEWLVFDNNKHIRMCSLPDMWNRTVTIGSAGKTFSVTGWQTGWAYGPKHLITNLKIVTDNSIYTAVAPIQEALAIIIEKETKRLNTKECYFTAWPLELKAKRDYLLAVLRKVGMKVIVPQGTIFIMADWSQLSDKVDLTHDVDQEKDVRFMKWMMRNVGIAPFPPSTFYSDEHKAEAEHLIRLCFFKKDEKLQKAAQLLMDWVRK